VLQISYKDEKLAKKSILKLETVSQNEGSRLTCWTESETWKKIYCTQIMLLEAVICKQWIGVFQLC